MIVLVVVSSRSAIVLLVLLLCSNTSLLLVVVQENLKWLQGFMFIKTRKRTSSLLLLITEQYIPNTNIPTIF